ncbi:MAG TPA: hypothetical protein VN632_01930 [Stellaceae bacterium]|nr:hypothetical protein [Stellaceae bacterium]
MTAAEYRNRAEECERLAGLRGFENQRALLLEIAVKWRELARQVEAADAMRRDGGDNSR